ncbi:uncharacterized protein PAC_13115, partial [Phialocephala subalpina]
THFINEQHVFNYPNTTIPRLPLDDLERPLPPVQTFERSTATVEEILTARITTGGCVIKNAASATSLAAIEEDIRPYIEKDRAWTETSSQARPAASQASLRNQKPSLKPSSSIPSTKKSAWSQGSGSASRFGDSHTIPSQLLASEYDIHKEIEIGYFVASKKTIRGNGATRFIPGSHLWSPSSPPSKSLTVYAELEPGDGFLILGSCFHGGSANSTTDEERLVYRCFMTKGFLRQEENQYLLNGWEKLREWYGVEALKMLGWGISDPYMGWVDFKSPLMAMGVEDYRKENAGV